jgi:hypothetical protein
LNTAAQRHHFYRLFSGSAIAGQSGSYEITATSFSSDNNTSTEYLTNSSGHRRPFRAVIAAAAVFGRGATLPSRKKSVRTQKEVDMSPAGDLYVSNQ